MGMGIGTGMGNGNREWEWGIGMGMGNRIGNGKEEQGMEMGTGNGEFNREWEWGMGMGKGRELGRGIPRMGGHSWNSRRGIPGMETGGDTLQGVHSRSSGNGGFPSSGTTWQGCPKGREPPSPPQSKQESHPQFQWDLPHFQG